MDPDELKNSLTASGLQDFVKEQINKIDAFNRERERFLFESDRHDDFRDAMPISNIKFSARELKPLGEKKMNKNSKLKKISQLDD